MHELTLWAILTLRTNGTANLKKYLIIVPFLFTINQKASSQNALDKVYERQDAESKRLDSLRNFYSGSYSDTAVNGMKLKKISEYSAIQFEIPNYYYGKVAIKDSIVIGDQPPARLTLNDCNPCYLYNYRHDGTLWNEGVFNTDCPYGPTIRYFRDGKISMTGNYVPDMNRKAEHCSIAHGESAVYNHDGGKIISEFWENGKLIKLMPYKLNGTGAVKFIVDNKVLFINDTVNLVLFQKIKLESDLNQNFILKNGYTVSIKVWQGKKQESLYWFENLKSFNDSIFTATIKKKHIKTKAPMQMSIDIYETMRDEIIETHFLVFEMKRNDN